MRPAIKGRPKRGQGVVQEDQPIFGGQADVGLEALDRAGQGVPKRGRRGIRTVVGPSRCAYSGGSDKAISDRPESDHETLRCC